MYKKFAPVFAYTKFFKPGKTKNQTLDLIKTRETFKEFSGQIPYSHGTIVVAGHTKGNKKQYFAVITTNENLRAEFRQPANGMDRIAWLLEKMSSHQFVKISIELVSVIESDLPPGTATADNQDNNVM